jgi:hypothetical protein
MFLGVFLLITSRAILFWSLPIGLYLLFVAVCVNLFILAQNLRRPVSGLLQARAALDPPTSLRAMTLFAAWAKLMRNAF